MLSTYNKYINDNFPKDPFLLEGKCVDFSRKMNKCFPELIFVFGLVESEFNNDNFEFNGKKIIKQYPHAWLETFDGNILDPTINQFILIKNIKYKKFKKDDTYTGSCHNCGRLAFNNSFSCPDHECKIAICEDFGIKLEQLNS